MKKGLLYTEKNSIPLEANSFLTEYIVDPVSEGTRWANKNHKKVSPLAEMAKNVFESR